MTTKKLEYDSSLGGRVNLDNHVATYRYAAAVVQEMRQIMAEVKSPKSTKLIFQTLPKHMRRRAMSHHPKRLPRKYRTAHIAQMAKAGKPPIITKRPSRKFRRRPKNLLSDYLRRQRQHKWLETHIWHAKRFHMINRWGYRLPYASCDKTYRACYRATAKHCLLQDISFYACIQLEGVLAQLHEGFKRLSSTACGLSITAKSYVTGKREGQIELFRADTYPECALGKVSFLWKAVSEENETRILWLWVHPSIYTVLLEELIKVFKLKAFKVKREAKENTAATVEIKVETEVENPLKLEDEQPSTDSKAREAATKPKVKKMRRLRFMTKNLAHLHIKNYANDKNTIRLSELRDTMNRFRLTGPLAQSVLAHVLKPKSLESTSDNWFQERLKTVPAFRKQHEIGANYWRQCSNLTTPAELISNMIIALNVEDPRLQRPQKRTKALPHIAQHNVEATPDVCLLPTGLAESALWSAELRHDVSTHMLTNHEYCKLRAKHAVVPGEPCKFEADLQPVPVLLLQRPGSQDAKYKRLGYGCGWDLIVPAGYGMSFWLCMIMWGARPGGLREFETIAREAGTEQHLPDTVAGLQSATERHIELRNKYFRMPTNKRCNYRKLAIVSPFRAPFTDLVRDWLPASNQSEEAIVKNCHNSFHILRDRVILSDLQMCLRQNSKLVTANISPKCLIQLQLRMKSRGNPTDFSLICLPTRADFKRNLKRIKFESHEPVYTEPLMPDAAEKERKTVRVQHKKLLKRLRARRVREKRKKQETSTTPVRIRAANTAHMVAAQFKKMCSLWLPEDFSTHFSVRKQCTREVFGYITNAKFSFTEATFCGIGYVTIEGFKQLLARCRKSQVKQPLCLVRGTNTRHYRFVTFKINLDV